MTERQRQLAFVRFMEIEAELKAVAECRVVDGDPATVEGELQREKDFIATIYLAKITGTAAMDDDDSNFHERIDALATYVGWRFSPWHRRRGSAQ